MVTRLESDVLVIGTGGAGLRAAIAADEAGADVLIVCKSPAGYNNATVVAGGGFRAAMEGLSPEEHIEDTLRVGNRLNDRRLLEVFAREGGERVLELQRFGVEMRIRYGGISVGDTPGLMGLGMTKPMVEHLRGRGVRILENAVVTKLLLREGATVGAAGYDVKNDEPLIFSFKAVVLATGGAGALYERTDCPLRVTGDGYSLAFHAGVELRDMEFVQFFPMALAEPGFPPYLIGGPFSEEGRIVNRLGEEIPVKHGVVERPLVLKSRGPLSIAIFREIQAGNGVDGAVLLDAREPVKKYANEDWFKTQRYAQRMAKLGAAERPLRVAPIAHFCMGGVVADVDGVTRVPGLYAAGEVVGGVHGANRHGGNALTAITVFGARAGDAAAEYSKEKALEPIDDLAQAEFECYERMVSDAGEPPFEILGALKALMWTKVGPVRSREALFEALDVIEGLRERARRQSVAHGREMLAALEVPMALDAAELIVNAAIAREESRGAHFREDHPSEDEAWLRTVIVEKEEDGVGVSTRPL